MWSPVYYTVSLVKRKGSPMTFKILYAAIALWAVYNFTTALTCKGDVSPFYWPPVTTCTVR